MFTTADIKADDLIYVWEEVEKSSRQLFLTSAAETRLYPFVDRIVVN